MNRVKEGQWGYLGIVLPKEIIRKLKTLAVINGITVSSMVRTAIKEYIAKGEINEDSEQHEED